NAGSALKITVDGVRQPETRGFHHAGISGLDPDLYKTTEVSVGNNSVTLGNNAIGGGVAFTTVDAGVYNLTDAYYYEHVSNTGDKAMGRNVKVALSYQF
ncbi:hypothetical protein ZP13_26325, partial [Salmonella enterica subsp. enterica]|nr:hypothetical protein [Salmonella enterica subsp. enterica]